MNQNRGTAELAPATVRHAHRTAGASAGVALDLPEDPLSRRASRRQGAPAGRRARISGTPALVLLASLIVSLLAASSAPTPLYAIYQQHWGFSPITTTIVYGVYALTVLASLLTLGRLSDYVGRRPVLLTALAVQVVAMAVFATAGGVGGLLIARVIQGLSTGAARQPQGSRSTFPRTRSRAGPAAGRARTAAAGLALAGPPRLSCSRR